MNIAQNRKPNETTAPVRETPITSPGAVTVKTSSNVLPVVAAFLGAALSTFVFILVIIVVLGRRKTEPSVQHTGSFCCTDEALMVLGVLNSSADPCEDFYAHVCSRVDLEETGHLSPMLRVAMKRKLVEWDSTVPGPSAAGQMLAALRNPIRQVEELQDIADFVTAIAKVGVISQKMELSHLVRLFAELSMRYDLLSVVSFAASEGGAVATIRRNDGCDLGPAHTEDVGPAVDAFNKAQNQTVTLQQLQELQGQLRATQGTNSSEALSRSIFLSPFSGLSEKEWEVLVRDFIFSLHPNVTVLKTWEDGRLNDFLDILVKAPSQSITVAYAVICTALMTRDKFFDVLPDDAAKGTRISCQLLGVCEIEELFLAEALSSRHLDRYVRGLFAQIRLNIIDQAAGHPVLGGTSKEQITQELNKLRMVVAEEIVVSDIHVPNVSDTFVANLLAARSYVFDVRKAKLSRKIPDLDSLSLPAIVRRDDVIYVPTNAYVLLGQKPSRVAALGIPVVGVDLAAEVWSFLLERPWPGETRENIETRLECFARKPFNHTHHEEPLRTAAVALGVPSAMDAMMTAEWNTAAVVNGTETSLGRLVYLKWVYDRCDILQEYESRLDINTALRNSPAFAQVFGCSKSAAMAVPNCCLKSC